MDSVDRASFGGKRREPWDQVRGLDALLAKWESSGRVTQRLTLDRELPARSASYAELPAGLAPGVVRALEAKGIERLYAHQREAYDAAMRREHVVVATPTASGKSLCYVLPILQSLALESGSRALFMFPTKALSRDQEAALREQMQAADISCGAVTYDGDTPADARRAARERSGVLLTNPDMLHAGILPHHAGWARLFSNLKYVVIDELHIYRGVFGSHLANVIRRLRRVARFHGSDPVFIMASATIGNPKDHAERLLGSPVTAIAKNGAPQGPRRVMVYNPPVVNAELGIRASYLKSSVRLASDLVRAGVSTLVFGQSRNGVEVMLKYLRDRLSQDNLDPSLIHAYRGGYLPKTRRQIESALRAGDIRCVVATSALELGIDIGMLDAVVCAGYPGTYAGLWQRFGRAGRRSDRSLALLVTSSMPVDQFVARQAGQLIDTPVEHARIDANNVEILIQHLKCGAFELPFEPGDRFGNLPMDQLKDALGFLADHRVLHPSEGAEGTVWHWASDAYPANQVSLRSSTWDNVTIIDLDRDQTIAEMDWHSAHTMLHEQAIYQHLAMQYQVEKFDHENHKAFVRQVKPDYYTTAMTHTRVSVLVEDEGEPMEVGGGLRFAVGAGEVSVIEKIVGYKKIKFHTHENVGYGDVHLPEIEKHTSAMWFTFPESWVQSLAYPRAHVIDALRGIGKAMHLVASVGLMVDPRDLGHCLGDRNDADLPPSKGTGTGPGFDPTLFLYDSVAGGIGLAPRLYDERWHLWRRTRAMVESCLCLEGCPSCIGPQVESGPDGTRDVEAPGRKSLAVALLVALGAEATH